MPPMKAMDATGYGTGIRLRATFDDTTTRVRAALKEQGRSTILKWRLGAALDALGGEPVRE
jgi:hypothetical protein